MLAYRSYTNYFYPMGVSMKSILVFLFSTFSFHTATAWGSKASWVTACQVFGRHSFISEVHFVSDMQLLTFKLYEDKNCMSHASTVTYEGFFSTDKVFGEGIQLDSRPSKVNFTVHIQSVIDQYNDPNSPDGCGRKNWELNVSQDVSGQYCRPFQMPTINKVIHDIYKIQGNELRFGGIPLNWDLADLNSRPQKLSSIIFHRLIVNAMQKF